MLNYSPISRCEPVARGETCTAGLERRPKRADSRDGVVDQTIRESDMHAPHFQDGVISWGGLQR